MEKLKQKLSKVLYQTPSTFDKLKWLEHKIFGVNDDSAILHAIANVCQLDEVLQIGANDGIRNDPVRSIIVKQRPKAVLVEADPSAYECLKKSYNYMIKGGAQINLINAFVSNCGSGGLKYYSLSEMARHILPNAEQTILARKAGYSKDRLVSYLRSVGYVSAEELVKENSVPHLTWFDILQKISPQLIVIDTEGLDWQLLAEFDLSRHQPVAFYFESGEPLDWDAKIIAKYQVYDYRFRTFKDNAIFIKHDLSQKLEKWSLAI